MRARLLRAIIGAVALMAAASGILRAQSASPTSQPAPLTAAQLDQLLAPIALDPDPLLGQILMASTYPLEVVEAARWLQDPNNARLKGDQLAAALQGKNWDPSVQSLVPFPQVLRMMDSRLDWLQMVGDAFLSQQSDVMDSVQRLRRQAEAAGSLKSSPQQTVTEQDQSVVIEPTNPDIVYAPVYDPTLVYGAWPYPEYPPYYLGLPDFVLGPPWFPGWWWGPAIDSGFFLPFWGWDHWDWRQHKIHVDRDRFRRLGGQGYRPDGGDAWQHDPSHRRGVAYRDPVTAQRFAPSAVASPNAVRVFRGFTGGSNVTPGIAGAPTTERSTIFDRSGTGADTRAHSERGHQSQQAPIAVPRSYGGATRSFGGGGRSVGGGGRRP